MSRTQQDIHIIIDTTVHCDFGSIAYTSPQGHQIRPSWTKYNNDYNSASACGKLQSSWSTAWRYGACAMQIYTQTFKCVYTPQTHL